MPKGVCTKIAQGAEWPRKTMSRTVRWLTICSKLRSDVLATTILRTNRMAVQRRIDLTRVKPALLRPFLQVLEVTIQARGGNLGQGSPESVPTLIPQMQGRATPVRRLAYRL